MPLFLTTSCPTGPDHPLAALRTLSNVVVVLWTSLVDTPGWHILQMTQLLMLHGIRECFGFSCWVGLKVQSFCFFSSIT